MYLWLSAAWIGDEEGTVVSDKGSLELVLCVLIDELLVVGDEGLGNSLTDGVDLGSVTTTGDADADIDTSELVEANNQERLVKLFAKLSERVPCISFAIPNSSLGSSIVFSRVGFMYLEAEDLWLDEVERLAVNLDKALSGLYTIASQYFVLSGRLWAQLIAPCTGQLRWQSSSCRSTERSGMSRPCLRWA